jgi:lipopolysaccharide exporter
VNDSATDGAGHGALKRRTAHGAALLIASNVAVRALGLVGTLLLTHYLAPAEFGAVGAALIWLLTANQLSTLGVGTYVVVLAERSREGLFEATALHLALGFIAIGAVVACAGPLSRGTQFLDSAAYVLPLAVSVMLDRIRYMPERMLVRDMRFGVVSLVRSGGEFVYVVAAIGTAMAGAGAMALVWGNLARAAVRTLVTFGATQWREWALPHRMRPGRLREIVAYGGPLSAGALFSFGSRNWDNLIIGHYFGTATMGQYQLAYNLADVPATQIGEQIGDVLLPSFARMAPAQRPAALLKSTALLALVTFPLAVGIGAVAPVLVRTMLGAAWSGVAPMLVVLSALSVTRPLGWTIGAFLAVEVRHRTHLLMVLETLKILCLGTCLVLAGGRDPLLSCAAVGLAFGLHALACMVAARRYCTIPLHAFLASVLPALLACLPLAAAAWSVMHFAPGHWSGPVVLLLQVAAGAVAYLLAAGLLARRHVAELLQLARQALGRRAAARPA